MIWLNSHLNWLYYSQYLNACILTVLDSTSVVFYLFYFFHFDLKLFYSHFRLSFWALWCASNPSDRLFNVEICTSSAFGRLPNHRTQHVESFCVVAPFGAGTIFPGHAVWPRTAPHTKLPTVNCDDGFVVTTIGAVTGDEFGVTDWDVFDVGGDASTSWFWLICIWINFIF